MSAPPPDVRSLWLPPFKVAPSAAAPSFVVDARGTMMASLDDDDEPAAIPRGWGRVQYLACGNKLMTAWESWWAANIPSTATLAEAADLLNAAWGAK